MVNTFARSWDLMGQHCQTNVAAILCSAKPWRCPSDGAIAKLIVEKAWPHATSFASCHHVTGATLIVVRAGGALRYTKRCQPCPAHTAHAITMLTHKFAVIQIAHHLGAAKACMLGAHVRATPRAWRCLHGDLETAMHYNLLRFAIPARWSTKIGYVRSCDRDGDHNFHPGRLAT